MTKYKFLSVINDSSYSKHISLLYCDSNMIAPPNPTLEWLEQNWTPTAYSLDMIQKSAFLVAEAPYKLINQRVISENDIYPRYLFDTVDSVQMNRIRPCTMVHLKKHWRVAVKIVKETKEDYETKVLPYINAIPANRIAWIESIIDGSKEASLLVYRDDDLVIMPDAKWDGRQTSQLYLLAIAIPEITCLRALDGSHLDLLIRMRANIIKTLAQYGLDETDVRLLVHYQPSYYRLHIHVIHLAVEGFHGMIVGQSHLLDDIIENIAMDGDYYQKRTLTYALLTSHDLYPLLK